MKEYTSVASTATFHPKYVPQKHRKRMKRTLFVTINLTGVQSSGVHRGLFAMPESWGNQLHVQ